MLGDREHEQIMRGPWQVRVYQWNVIRVLGPRQGNARVNIADLCGTANPNDAAYQHTIQYAHLIADAPTMQRKLQEIRTILKLSWSYRQSGDAEGKEILEAIEGVLNMEA